MGRLSELSQSMKRNIEDAYRIIEAYLSNTLYIADNNVTLADYSVLATMSSLHGLHPIDSNKLVNTNYIVNLHFIPQNVYA